MARQAARQDMDESLAIRAAWLHYSAGMTQVQVGAHLGVSGVKAHRLVAWANRIGAVKVSVEGDVAECLALELELKRRFGLGHCQVVPDLGEAGLPLRALGPAGAAWLRARIEDLPGGVIGVGHGRTLAAAIAALPLRPSNGVRFVSLMGGLTRNYAANPHDVIHRLAERTGATAYVVPVPFFANSPEDKAVLLAQRGVGDVMALGARADLMLVGIGTSQPDAQLVASGMVDPAEIRQVRELGGLGEMLGHFFDASGRPVRSSLSARTVSPGLAALEDRRIVAVAGGSAKVRGIRSVLASGLLAGLVTDDRTAASLVGLEAF